MSALLGGLVTMVGVTTAPAYMTYPPITGNVACTYNGSSTFKPRLGYARGPGEPAVNPSVDSSWKVVGTLSSCTGTQTGGNPKHPGPVATGDVLMQGKAVDHACQSVTDHGLSVTKLRIRWYAANGAHLLISKGTGSATVDGLRNGMPYLSFPPPVPDPSYLPPGIITTHLTATINGASRAFPGKTVTMTAVSDQAIEDMPWPCSFAFQPLPIGIGGFSYHGARGASSLSVG